MRPEVQRFLSPTGRPPSHRADKQDRAKQQTTFNDGIHRGQLCCHENTLKETAFPSPLRKVLFPRNQRYYFRRTIPPFSLSRRSGVEDLKNGLGQSVRGQFPCFADGGFLRRV